MPSDSAYINALKRLRLTDKCPQQVKLVLANAQRYSIQANEVDELRRCKQALLDNTGYIPIKGGARSTQAQKEYELMYDAKPKYCFTVYPGELDFHANPDVGTVKDACNQFLLGLSVIKPSKEQAKIYEKRFFASSPVNPAKPVAPTGLSKDAVHAKCLKAADYMGCVKFHSNP